MSATLHFHGAAGCVTGFCALLETDQARILVDCGLFQGTKTLKTLNYGPFPFDARKIDAVLLTHAHIDHSGLLPKLALAGFQGPIYATVGTRDLCSIMLPDSGDIQELEVEQLNRRNRRRAIEPLTAIYTAADATAAMRLFRTIRLNEWVEVATGVRARWWNAGHILGSASIEIEVASATSGKPLRLCFSGDVGPGGRDLADDPQGPIDVDHVVVESTYGAAERQRIDATIRRRVLADELKAAFAAGGPLLIPAFAVERTQELIVDLIDLMEKTEAPPGPIFLDSPLAIRASDIFLRRGSLDSGDNPFTALRQSRLLKFTETYPESRKLEQQKGWHIIIAASGMCDAGRVRGHLRRLLPRQEASVMIVGYQAFGTLGRLLVDGQRAVRIQGDPISVNAHIRNIDVYSGHADGPGLEKWVYARAPVAGTVFLTHGEPDNLRSLRARLISSGFADDRIVVTELDQTYRLTRGQRAEPVLAGSHPRLDAGRLAKMDWHNGRAAFLGHFQDVMDNAPDDTAREAILLRLEAAIAGPSIPASDPDQIAKPSRA